MKISAQEQGTSTAEKKKEKEKESLEEDCCSGWITSWVQFIK